MGHSVDASGFPVDPDLRRLENHLSDLAAEWRGSEAGSTEAAELVRQYHATVARLVDLGWDARTAELGYEDLLPDEIMPEAYLRRHDEVVQPVAENGSA